MIDSSTLLTTWPLRLLIRRAPKEGAEKEIDAPAADKEAKTSDSAVQDKPNPSLLDFEAQRKENDVFETSK